MSLFSPITSKIFGGFSAVLAVALVSTMVVNTMKINSLRDQIHNPKTGYIERLKIANSNLVTCKNNAELLQETITEQNGWILKQGLLADGLRDQAKKNLAIVGKLADANKKAAARVDAVPVTGDQCEDIEAMIEESIK